MLVLQDAHLDPQLHRNASLAFADPFRMGLKYLLPAHGPHSPFELAIGETSFTFQRKHDSIAA